MSANREAKPKNSWDEWFEVGAAGDSVELPRGQPADQERKKL